jgi:NAD(P)-dependent dehydrogenase (short-subunit alcohol dehydrogenase family)
VVSTAPNQTIALVTGANRGIGLAIVTDLARKGCHVLLGCRDLSRGEAASAPLVADGLSVTPVPLDITDQASVEAMARRIEGEFGRLDILVNNAGISLDFAPDLSPTERMQGTLDVNVLGLIRMTEAMAPLLAKSGHGRIVNLSSELASFALRHDPTWPYFEFRLPTYAASKSAVNALTVGYAKELEDKGVKVNAICPGYTATEATNFAGTRQPEQGAAVAARFALLDDDGPTGTFANEDGVIPW